MTRLLDDELEVVVRHVVEAVVVAQAIDLGRVEERGRRMGRRWAIAPIADGSGEGGGEEGR